MLNYVNSCFSWLNLLKVDPCGLNFWWPLISAPTRWVASGAACGAARCVPFWLGHLYKRPSHSPQSS